MNYLNIEKSLLEELKAIDTAREIEGQPELWASVYDKVISESSEIISFLNEIPVDIKKIILTGAGTSAFIGYSLEGKIQRTKKTTTISVSTTHLVSHPQDYFEPTVPTLMISFARSGNSPESVAAVKFADKYSENCYHLIITCNAAGSLAQQSFKNKSYVFILPEAANDKSLAMTGSYSGMILSALLINDIENIRALKATVDKVCKYGATILETYLDTIKDIAALPFDRTVFLGSGPQYGTAMESHLKLQELSDGQVICKNDSYLGFRHGPKAVVNEKTLLVYYFSNKQEVFVYEKDLVKAMEEGKKPLFQLGVSETNLPKLGLDKLIVLSDDDETLDESYLSVCTILVGQLLGFYKSLDLGLNPDSPSLSGAISRVVKGVKIY
ncbi:SIS domain-containing protein [Cellulophaga sp. E16_2]|uniref:SIS domain-containing protein n=1 Tax=unclassified Cellulophaga TaxID=2634405 RepID=UPI0013FD315E|nr:MULTISPECIES: SIS domain-containing protein [unclassified Cellulophaga]MBO0590170.1 SIS domain-containing protein [Cellulophaga sp. E16_2]